MDMNRLGIDLRAGHDKHDNRTHAGRTTEQGAEKYKQWLDMGAEYFVRIKKDENGLNEIHYKNRIINRDGYCQVTKSISAGHMYPLVIIEDDIEKGWHFVKGYPNKAWKDIERAAKAGDLAFLGSENKPIKDNFVPDGCAYCQRAYHTMEFNEPALKEKKRTYL